MFVSILVHAVQLLYCHRRDKCNIIGAFPLLLSTMYLITFLHFRSSEARSYC